MSVVLKFMEGQLEKMSKVASCEETIMKKDWKILL